MCDRFDKPFMMFGDGKTVSSAELVVAVFTGLHLLR
jgi:hypothetical protein